MSGETSAPEGVQTGAADEENFESGFTGQETSATATPAPPPEPVSAEPPAPTPAPQPELVQITKDEHDRLTKQGEQLAQMNSKFDKVFGKVGALEQVISKLRTETPAGEKVEIDAKDFAELQEMYPDLAGETIKGLNRVLGRFKGTGGAKDVDDRITQRFEAAKFVTAEEATERMLNGILPGWRKEVNTPEFGEWLKAQPEDVRALQDSADEVDAARMLRLYDRHLLKSVFASAPAPTPAPSPAPVKPAGNQRQRQLAAAVPPKGDGDARPAPPAEVDEFEAGFQTGRG
jgi:hypothetical protein